MSWIESIPRTPAGKKVVALAAGVALAGGGYSAVAAAPDALALRPSPESEADAVYGKVNKLATKLASSALELDQQPVIKGETATRSILEADKITVGAASSMPGVESKYVFQAVMAVDKRDPERVTSVESVSLAAGETEEGYLATLALTRVGDDWTFEAEYQQSSRGVEVRTASVGPAFSNLSPAPGREKLWGETEYRAVKRQFNGLLAAATRGEAVEIIEPAF